MAAKIHAVSAPGIEMVLHVDRSADTLSLANRPILLEGPSAINGRLVGAGRDVDVVVCAVRVERTFVLASTARVVCAIVLNDIVFYEGIASPAIDSKVAIA